MDERLRGLQREAEARPSDEGAAIRYERALRAAGEEEALQARFRLKFACPLRFEELRAGADPAIRRCERCQRDVHYVDDLALLRERVGAGECVAFFAGRFGEAVAHLAADEALHGASEEGSACLVEFTRQRIELGSAPIEAGLAASFDPWLLRRHQVFPIRIEAGTLEVAWASSDPVPRELSAALQGASGARPLRVFLAGAGEVERALDLYSPEPMLMGIVAPEIVPLMDPPPEES
ncbi:MAG TPA: hypothetical protein DEA08_25920 [Planctomycetes bacterium]|nr:hypothetical protein [Planctomycetota bacterium]